MVPFPTTSKAADLALAWLLTYTLHSTLLLSAAWLATRRLGARRLRLQETIWRCALLGALVTAPVQLALGGLGHAPLAGQWALAGTATAPEPPRGEERIAPLPLRPEAGVVEVTGVGGFAARSGRVGIATGTWSPKALQASSRGPLRSRWLGTLTRFLVPAWLAGALALMLGYLRSYRQLRRQLRCRLRVVSGGVLARLAALAAASGIASRVRLTCTWRLRVPVALADRGAEVCVPPRALFELSDERQDALLAHELAHLARRDTVWLPLTGLLVALCFFQPLNWLAWRRLRNLSELLCDEWAVARTGRPLSLAGCLAEVAGWSLGAPGASPRPLRASARLLVPGMADRPSQLAHRIRRLLDAGAREESGAVGRRAAVGLAAGLLAVVLVAPVISAGAAPTTPSQALPAARPATPSGGATATLPWAMGHPSLSAAPGAVLVAGMGVPLFAEERGAAVQSATTPAGAAPAAGGASGDASATAAAATSAADAAPSAAAAAPATAAAVAAPPPGWDEERERLGAAIAQLSQLDKLSRLSEEQIEALSAAADRIARELDGRLAQAVKDLDRRMAAARAAMPKQPTGAAGKAGAPGEREAAAQLAGVDAELADLARQLRPSAAEMARLDAELRKLAAGKHPLSDAEIQRIQRETRAAMEQLAKAGMPEIDVEHVSAEVQRALAQLPKLGLSEAEIARLRADMQRALASTARGDHLLSAADRERLMADAHRLAEQQRPSEAQLEELRDLAHQREDLERLLAGERAEIESMRREVEQQTRAFRDQARRLVEARRQHPAPSLDAHPAPADPHQAHPNPSPSPASPSPDRPPAASQGPEAPAPAPAASAPAPPPAEPPPARR